MPPIISTMKISPAIRSRPSGMAMSVSIRLTGFATPGVRSRLVSNRCERERSFSSVW